MTYGVLTNGDRTTVYPTTEDVADQLEKRLAGVHPNARKRISKAPVYVSGGLQEYQIRQRGTYFYIHKYNGGLMHPKCKGNFTSYKTAENALIEYLRTTDRFDKKAIWPGR